MITRENKKMRALTMCLLIAGIDGFAICSSQKRTTRFHNHKAKAKEQTSADPILVALTREDGKNGKLMKELAGRTTDDDNGNPILAKELPCIAHADGPDLGKLESTLQEQSWDYVAVTSPEAARVLSTAWKADTMKTIPSVAVVGKATQAALEKFGIPVDFCPSKATAKTLVAELPPILIHDDDEATGTTTTAATSLLYPASAKAATTLQDGLSERGFIVSRLNTYDTVTASWTQEEKELASSVKVACFGSPSAVEGWLANTDNDNKRVLAACIGETSAKACRRLEWPEERIFFPDKPGIVGWADSILEEVSSLRVSAVAHQE